MTITADGIIRRAVRTALLTSGTIAAGLAGHSQQARAAAPADAEEAPALQEVVVTGSRITAPNLESISPVTAISADEVKETGVTRVEDLLNSLPQVVADQGSGISMGSSGTATINLRGLGPQRTLVLINGRRLMGGDPVSPSNTNLGYASTADVNQIPVALIERVDVLTGGASSTYGADAVAGVVNFVMNDHFEGVRVDANFGIYNHSNHEDWINPLAAKRGFNTVTGTNWDGQNKDLTVIMGHNFADGAGNFEGYIGYRRASPITADHRDFSNCVLGDQLTGGTPWVCGGSSTSAPAIWFDPVSGAASQINPDGTVGARYARYNYAATHYLQRIDERYTAGFFGHLKFNDHAEAYTEFGFMDDTTRGNYAPAGAFIASGKSVDKDTGLPDGNWSVNCGAGAFGNAGMNPYMTASEFGTWCNPGVGGVTTDFTNATRAAGNTSTSYQVQNGVAQLTLGRRNVEGGPRMDEYTHTTWRGVLGLRGAINEAWNYDVSGIFGKTRSSDYHNNDTSSVRMQEALLATKDPTTGAITCLSGNPACVPWNIFNPTIPVTSNQLTYFTNPGIFISDQEEDIVSGFVSGDLTSYGVKLPTAEDGLKAVFGSEYRRVTLSTRPDQEYLSGDLAGNGSPIPGVTAGMHVWEAFTEFRMPLVRNMPGVQSLDFETGYRYSNYTTGFSTNTYKFGVEWKPINDVRLRASYNRAVRAPNLQELFRPDIVGLDSGGDSCAAPSNLTAAQCALQGVTPAQYVAGGGGVAGNPAGQYQGQIGGNPKLRPEVGKTYNVGVVFTPSFLPGFSATLDYTDIKITDIITSFGPNLIQGNCVLTGSASSYWCQLVHRSATGSLWTSPQGYTVDPLLNLGSLENRSVDVGLAERFDMGSFGKLHARLDGTYLLKLITAPGTYQGLTSPTSECAGRFGPSCAPATPKWRHRLAVDWQTPLSGLGVGATWRFIGKARNTLLDPTSPDYVGDPTQKLIDDHIPNISYLDLRASYQWNKVTIRTGVNNVADKDPPLFDTVNSGGNSIYAESNTYAGMYDMAGRFVYLNLTVDF
ncbi:MAG: TonB-dependent receptor [Gammaproteobacteria bacterium]|nr:TonB-dependent receptor [Gammaproteobacteria bacterium]